MKAVVFTNSLDREDKLTVIRDVGGPLVKSSGARLSECQLCFAPRSVTRCRDVVNSLSMPATCSCPQSSVTNTEAAKTAEKQILQEM